jgi:hypothetical protein
MTTVLVRVAILAAVATFFGNSLLCQPLAGTPGSAAGDRWQSSWLENVIVRLLPDGSQPESPDGIEGGVRKVPASHTLDIKLESDHPKVKQISVHAGPEAFGQPLGPNNGKIRIISIERRE